MSLLVAIIFLVVGFVLLTKGADFFIENSATFAEEKGISPHVVGVTIVAFGTSVPELAASVIAALKKEKAISMGNLIGSNIFNIASVLGITSILQPIAVKSQEVLTSDIFWMLGFAAILVPLAFLPKKFEIGRYKGLFIVIAYAAFISFAFME